MIGPGERYSSPWLFASWGEGLDEFAARFHRSCGRGPSTHGTRGPSLLNTWEAVYFDHDLAGCSSSPSAPPRWGSSGSCSTTAGSAGVATTRRGWATGTSTSTSGPTGCAVRRPRPRARHGLRAVGRAGDGQPRLRPRRGPTPSGSSRPSTARASPSRHQHVLDLVTRRRTPTSSSAMSALVDGVRHRLHQVGPQPAAGRRRPPPSGGRASTRRPGGLPDMAELKRGTPAWRSSRAAAAVAGRPRHHRVRGPRLGLGLHRRARATSAWCAGPA